jgi:probable F420-dependent oxidoreductase
MTPAETVRIVPDGQLAFGVQLPVQALSLIVSEPWEREEGVGVAALTRAAEAADRAGFFYVAICDHVAIPRSLAERMSTQWYDPVSTLGYLAARTQHARLLTNVFVGPYRHPLQTAKQFATLDQLSGGRVILGLGAGHVEGEFEALDVSFDGRGRLLDEVIDDVKAAWSDEFPVLDGPTWQSRDGGQRPRPVQQPRPPIWVGGSSKPAMRRVAERADGWIPQGTPRKDMPASIAYLTAHRDNVRPGAELDIGVITEPYYVGTPDWDVGPYTITGSAEEIAESYNEFGAMGCSHLQIKARARSIDELCDQYEAFGAQVAPLLTRA